MRGTLVLTILTVQSSYRLELEEPLPDDAGVPDTIQWWVAPTGSWRIRTYALDHDIHTHSIAAVDNLIELALTNVRKNYGDVIRSQHVIELSNCLSVEATSAAFRTAGLEPRIEIAEGLFAFWKPDDARYHTQSEPK